MLSAEVPSTAAILIIGDEVLSAKVGDANGPYLIGRLRERGVAVTELRVVGDRRDAIVAAVRALAATVTYLFTTGGIGPTHDDVTIKAVAEAFGRSVVRNPEIERRLREKFGDHLNAARLRLAEVPEGTVLEMGPEDLLPVLRCENVYILPGPPSFVRLCFERIAPTLRGAPFFSQAFFLNASEAEIAALLEAVQQHHPQVAIGSYPRFDGGPATYRVKVTLDSRSGGALEAASAELTQVLRPEWLVQHAE